MALPGPEELQAVMEQRYVFVLMIKTIKTLHGATDLSVVYR